MHDNNDPGPEEKASTGEHQLARVHWMLRCAVQSTGIILAPGDVARLAMGFNNAMYEDGATILWSPRLEETAVRP